MVPWPSGDRVVQVAQRREAGEYYIELDTPITLPGPVGAHQCLEFNVPSLDAALRDAAGASAFIERAIPAGEPF
jgi:hypothetical protein